MAGVLRSVFRKLLQGVDGMLPARVVSYDRKSNTAMVQPLIQIVGTSGSSVSRSSLAKIPVLALGGGGFVINFPLKGGDLGWIEASDRDISLYMQSQNEAKPNTLRMHSFSDGRFIPDVFSKFDVSDDDADAMVIQTYGGGSKISIKQNSIDFTADQINLTGNQSISIKAPIISQAGDLNSTGSANFAGKTTIEGTPWAGHQHTGVQTGGSNTGGVA
jgi:hypothetical protein